MTGIERLYEIVRELGGISFCYDLYARLGAIADQIERERACDEDAIENVRLIVGGVIDDMERHTLGHEGMEDSPVARWARELREALGGDVRDPADDVSMSAYDLLPQEDREAVAWVRYHGGRDEVRMELDNLRGAIKETCARLGVEHTGDLTADAQGIWRAIDRLKSLLGDSVPRAAYERHLARRQRQIDESHAALRRRRETISELNRRACDLTRENAELRKRAMPEGMCWPVFEDGKPVRIGDEISWRDEGGVVNSVELQDGGYFILHAADGAEDWILPQYFPGEPVKRPVPKVLDADGVDTSVGDTVYDRDGETDTPLTVVDVSSDLVRCEYTWKDGKTYRPCYPPDQLTHERPVADTWERLEEDATVSPEAYCAKRGIDFSDVDGQHRVLDEVTERMARDLVRRAKTLAERDAS